LPQGERPAPSQDLQKVSTPHKRTCEEVSKFLKVPLTGKVKLLVLQGEHGLVAVALRGDHQLNEVKASKHPKIGTFTMAAPEAVQAAFGCEVGFLGPVGCPIPLIIDHAAAVLADFVCGANDNHHHYTGANWLRDAAFTETADLRLVQESDPAPDGSGAITLLRGIEGGHVFQLGQKYSKAMGLSVLNEKGEAVIPEMGCYGIGVSRLVAATLEQKHDDKGMIWPESLAPFTVIVCPIGADKSEAVKATSEQLYQDLRAKGVEVLLDDRGLRPGPMFADADLIGIPHRIVVGDKGLANGQVEYKARTAPAAEMLALSEVLGRF
jgi:prolyl-tRNA synthetase